MLSEPACPSIPRREAAARGRRPPTAATALPRTLASCRARSWVAANLTFEHHTKASFFEVCGRVGGAWALPLRRRLGWASGLGAWVAAP